MDFLLQAEVGFQNLRKPTSAIPEGDQKRRPADAVDAEPHPKLTGELSCVITHTMSNDAPLSDAIRRAILESELPLLRIAQETGVERASLSRFVRGKNSLRLDIADKLAVYFGLAIIHKKPKE